MLFVLALPLIGIIELINISYRRSGKTLLKYQFNSFLVITSLILLTILIRHRNYNEKFDADHSNGLYRRKDNHFLGCSFCRVRFIVFHQREQKEFKNFRIVCSIYGQPLSYLYRMIYVAYVAAAGDREFRTRRFMLSANFKRYSGERRICILGQWFWSNFQSSL